MSATEEKSEGGKKIVIFNFIDGCVMAKKKSWFNLLKRLFISDTNSKPEKKEKRRKWIFGRLKVKRFASITAPTQSKDITVSETKEEQSKHALTVAIATAAAAEAAVAAAQVAAEVVKLTGKPRTTHQCGRKKKDDPEKVHEIRIDSPKILELAAIKIQTAFRGYLAKKALRALKGIVRLQAIIRGRNVRRQAITTLKCLQSIVNIQSQVCARRFQMGNHHCGENDDDSKQLQTLRDKIIKMDSNGQRRWDDSVLTKEEADALFVSKKEAIMKRERIKEYAFTHRKSAESEQNKVNGRWRYWLEQWVDTQVSKSKELEDLDTIWTPNRKHRELYRGKGLRLRSLQRQCDIEGLDSPISAAAPRRSFHRKQNSLGDEKSFCSSSPVVPTYMAATESAKAKARSMSSPKMRPGDLDTCSESYSPYKHKLSLISSIGRPSAYQQRSPSLKSVPGPIKSTRTTTTTTTIKDLSLNSDCSLLNWDRQSTFR
ncbi:hypothetical protein QYF36_003539 [Acer negundo]|nr:hypothetical protein QYF36_003539 [Acer negundo]